jgi:hypothetical protein
MSNLIYNERVKLRATFFYKHLSGVSCRGRESRSRKSAQDDKWSF